MPTHFPRITAATAGIILFTLLPFLPGRYDSLAVPLSLMARIFGVVGLLLVPVGALWVAFGYWSRLAARQYGIAIAALITSSVVWGLSVWEDYLPGSSGSRNTTTSRPGTRWQWSTVEAIMPFATRRIRKGAVSGNADALRTRALHSSIMNCCSTVRRAGW